MKDSIHFEVTLSVTDLWQFSMYHANSGIMGIFNVTFTLAAVAALILRWSTLTAGYRLLLVVCALVFTVMQPLMLFNKVRRQAKNSAIQKPMDLTFDGEGLLVEQDGQQVRFTWDQIGRMTRRPSQTIVYMDRVHAYLLPKRVLEGHEEELWTLVRAHMPKERRKGI